MDEQNRPNKNILIRALAVLWDWIATGFYLLAAAFMRRMPKLARPVVYHVLVVYYLLAEFFEPIVPVVKKALRLTPVRFVTSLLYALFVGWRLVMLSQTIQLQDVVRAEQWAAAHGEAVFAAALFFAAVVASLTAITRRRGIAALLTALPVLALTLVSFYKAVINGFPLMLSDFTLTAQAPEIFSFALSRIRIPPVTWSCLLHALGLVLLGWLLDGLLRCHARASLLALALSLSIAVFYWYPGVFQDTAVRLSDGCLTQAERGDQCGTVYGLYCAYVTSANADNDSYTDDNLNRLQNILYVAGHKGDKRSEVEPNIIFILSESFFDITEWDCLHFAEDPLPNLHRLQGEGLSGDFISSTYAGGTGYVELEVLTGLSSGYLSPADTMTSLTRPGIYDDLPSIPRMLRGKAGYHTVYLHTFDSSLYNRADTMPHLGFDDVVFADDLLVEAEMDGSYVSDMTLTREIIARFEQRTENTPLFIQATSMENHQPHYFGKYGYSSDLEYTCDIELFPFTMEALDALILGLHHADEALGALTDYFAAQDEPVMIVFYGDHLPSMAFGSGDSIYSLLELVSSTDTLAWSTDELRNMLTTDYLIWTNYGDRAAETAAQSAPMLGVNALRRSGLPLSAFYEWLSEAVAQDLLIYRPRLCVTADGVAHESVPDDIERIARDYQLVQYDTVYGDQRLLKYLR